MPSTGFTHPRQIANQYASALHANGSVTALVVHTVDSDGNYVSPGAGSTQLSIREILTSSGASVMDSTNNAIGVTIRAGSAAGTEYTDGDTDLTPNGGVIFFNNSSNTMRAVSALTPLPVSGSFSASTIVSVAAVVPGTAATNLGKVEDAQHASGDVGVMMLGVRRTTPTDLSAGNTDGDYEPLQLNGNGELYVVVNGGVVVLGPVRSTNSVAADMLVTATLAAGGVVRSTNSVAADLLVTATVAPGGVVRSTNSVAADLLVTATLAAGGVVRSTNSVAADLLVTATIGTNLQSTVAPSSGSSGLVVRQVIDNILTTASTNAFGGGSGSTTFSIQSSGASLRSYVTGYSITSTVQTPTVVCFRSSGVLLAPVVLAAISSAVTGVNLAVAPPGYLFRTIGASDALNLNTNGSSVSGFRVWVSYFRAP